MRNTNSSRMIFGIDIDGENIQPIFDILHLIDLDRGVASRFIGGVTNNPYGYLISYDEAEVIKRKVDEMRKRVEAIWRDEETEIAQMIANRLGEVAKKLKTVEQKSKTFGVSTTTSSSASEPPRVKSIDDTTIVSVEITDDHVSHITWCLRKAVEESMVYREIAAIIRILGVIDVESDRVIATGNCDLDTIRLPLRVADIKTIIDIMKDYVMKNRQYDVPSRNCVEIVDELEEVLETVGKTGVTSVVTRSVRERKDRVAQTKNDASFDGGCGGCVGGCNAAGCGDQKCGFN